jgi:hypothetical protein
VTIRAEEIRARLAEFASRWSVYERSERAEAQTFLNELFDCYGVRRSDVATFEEPQAGKFLDCIWERNCIIEMKAPGEAKRLAKHRDQALGYWRNSADPATNTPAPRYVVLCAFRKLEVWEPGAYPTQPRAVIDLVELPERYDALLFLTGEGSEAVFTGSQQQVTREAVGKVSELFHMLADRSAASEGELQDFLLQSVWCMFAEDLAMIPANGFTRLLEDLITTPRRSSADDLGRMFELLNSPPSVARHGLYKDVPYANGGLFAEAAHVHLEREELQLLLDAARDYKWNQVEPSIFGSLLEGGLGRDQQWALGAHYTHEVDIQKVVQPTIVRPWRERIENCTTLKQATDARLLLSKYVVLDPACGSGNFLYVAYRELRRIERDLNERIADLERHAGRAVPDGMTMGAFPLSNMKGIELEGFAVKLARVTLWMGHKLAIDEVGLAEDPLPLTDLSGIRRGDALRVGWPKADAIIGNPPFHGASNLRSALGDEYLDFLADRFGVGLKDLCVYWFRRAAEELPEGGRAGFVATNSISQNTGRDASLDYVVEQGGVITDAVSKQDWPGEAFVNVSIVNWKHGDATGPFALDGVEVSGITSSLRSGSPAAPAHRLIANKKRCFEGMKPAGKGFLLTETEAAELIAADPRNADVVRRYLTAHDLANDPEQSPTRWIIDFGLMEYEEALAYELPIARVRAMVKPLRDENRREQYRRLWWRFSEPRPALRGAVAALPRYLALTRHGKRIQFAWVDPTWCPSDATNVCAFDDYASLGVLISTIHQNWAIHQGSTLREDLRYTPTTCFETFPWPKLDASAGQSVAKAAQAFDDARLEACRRDRIGLTTLYNQMDEGGRRDIAGLQRRLDEAVAAAYGWPKASAQDGDATNTHLLELNHSIARGDVAYAPFG